MTALISALLAAVPVAPPVPDAAPSLLPETTLPPAAMPTALAAVLQDEEVMNRWTGNVGVGVNLTEGNAETLTANASADAQYRREKDRFTIKFLWTYKSDKQATPSVQDRKTFLSGQYDYFISDQTYLFGRLQGQADAAAALDLRATAAAGAGRQFIENEEYRFRGEAGLSYIDENFEGTVNDNEYLAAALSYSAGWVPNEKWDLAQDAFWYPSLEDSDQMTARVDTRAKYLMSESIFGQVQWIWDWTRTPTAGSGPSDHTILLTLGWAF